MAMTKIDQLKDIFCGPKSLLFQDSNVDLSQSTFTLTPQLELPVEVDTLKATMDDPTINHYKVIGLSGDWATTAELGDFNIEFVVPSKARALLISMFGEDAISDLEAVTVNTGDTQLDGAYHGTSLEPKLFKIKGTIVIVDQEKKNLMIVTNLSLYATMQYGDTGTKPVAFKFTGSVEGAGLKSVAWLTKGDADANVMKLTYTTDKATTRKLVPSNKRKTGLVISYNDGSNDIKEKYQDVRFSDKEWADDSNWETV